MAVVFQMVGSMGARLMRRATAAALAINRKLSYKS